MSMHWSSLRLSALVAFSALLWVGPGMADDRDSDGDGIRDDLDNCIGVQSRNCDQIDSNSDGFGNRCDPDFDNNGVVGISDFALFISQFGKKRGVADDFDPDVDLDSNGGIGYSDWLIFSRFWGDPPGPSGLDCAQGNFEPELATCAPHARNILVIVADDVGVDKIGAYGEHPAPPETPVIDSLAERGVLFTNAWSNPVCSPTRATALSGRYSFRTEVGDVIATREDGQPVLGLDPNHPNVAKQLREAGYQTAAFGKWHVAGCTDVVQGEHGSACGPDSDVFDPAHPVRSGFDYFAGSMGNIGGGDYDYCNWPKVEAKRVGPRIHAIEVTSTTSENYATWETVNDAIRHITRMREPWFAWVAFNAPHVPFHEVPEDPVRCTLPESSPAPSKVEKYEAMTEKMDQEIGRLRDQLDAHCNSLDRTTIIFFSDNGTPRSVTTAPFDSAHAKGTPYEGAINVPFIVAGPESVVPAGGEASKALVNTTDVFATVTDLAGVAASAEDSVSLVPYLTSPGRESQREWAYAERFKQSGFSPVDFHHRAIRGERYKLIHRLGAEPVFEFYDLVLDPFEEKDLMGGELPEAFYQLLDELASLLGTPCLGLNDGDPDCVLDDGR